MIRAAAAALLFASTATFAADPIPPEQETEHVVQAGETLGGIANRAQVPRILIIEANRLKKPYSVHAGQKLMIPRTRHHTVVRGETGFTIAYNYGVPWRDIATANGIDADAPLAPGKRLLIPTVLAQPSAATAASVQGAVSDAAVAVAPRFAWPASGAVRRGFAPRGKAADFHDGVDIRLPEGTAVRASAAGRVLFAGFEPRQFGNLVVVEHPGGYQTAYAFLNRVTVKAGEDVGAGERVGLSGRTGLARGPELHFEMRRNERPVDPAGLLPPRK